MLHIPSYNMGLAAGLAWKAAGKPETNFMGAKEDSPEYNYIMDILARSENAMFMPSSFLEGFSKAFATSGQFNFIDTSS